VRPIRVVWVGDDELPFGVVGWEDSFTHNIELIVLCLSIYRILHSGDRWQIMPVRHCRDNSFIPCCECQTHNYSKRFQPSKLDFSQQNVTRIVDEGTARSKSCSRTV
jgi:hypothetical protein